MAVERGDIQAQVAPVLLYAEFEHVGLLGLVLDFVQIAAFVVEIEAAGLGAVRPGRVQQQIRRLLPGEAGMEHRMPFLPRQIVELVQHAVAGGNQGITDHVLRRQHRRDLRVVWQHQHVMRRVGEVGRIAEQQRRQLRVEPADVDQRAGAVGVLQVGGAHGLRAVLADVEIAEADRAAQAFAEGEVEVAE